MVAVTDLPADDGGDVSSMTLQVWTQEEILQKHWDVARNSKGRGFEDTTGALLQREISAGNAVATLCYHILPFAKSTAAGYSSAS